MAVVNLFDAMPDKTTLVQKDISQNCF